MKPGVSIPLLIRPVVIVVAASALCGCSNTAQKGNSEGRTDPYRGTAADAADPAAHTVALLEFANASGQELAAEFLSLPAIKDAKYRVVIEMGSIQNHTRTPSSDFAQVQRRVFLTLAQSDLVRKGAKVVENKARMERDAASVSAPPQTDPVGRDQPVSAGGSVDTYALKDTYFLQGTFSEMSRGGGSQSTYQFDVTLTNAQSREIVFAKIFDHKQVR